MKNVWFISDTHWQHEAMLKFTGDDGKLVRPGFSNAKEFDEYMMENWNSVVKPGDKVWHLGDVFFGDFESYRDNIHKKLNGSKRLLLGNHDNDQRLFNLFEKVQLIRNWSEYDFVSSHIPMNNFSCYSHRKNKILVNVHGHVHSNDVPSDGYVNLSVERINYTPIHLEDVIVKVKAELKKMESEEN